MRRSLLFVTATLAATLVAVAPATSDPSGVAREPGQRVRPVLGPVETVRTYTHEDLSPRFGYVRAVVDRSGAVTAGWFEDDGYRTARRDRRGHWSAPVTVASCAGRDCQMQGASLGVDGAGAATIAWGEATNVPGVGVVEHVLVRSQVQGDAWSAPTRLSAGRKLTGGYGPQVCTAGNGAALVTFLSRRHGYGNVVVAAYRRPGGNWAKARRHVFRHAGSSQCGMSARGVALVLVKGRPTDSARLRAYRYRPGHGWSRPTVLGVSTLIRFSLAVSPEGRAIAAWVHSMRQSRSAVKARVMSANGRWGARATLSHRRVFDPYVGLVDTYPYPLAAAGRSFTVVWPDRARGIRASTKALTGRWHTTVAYPARSGIPIDLRSNPKGRLSLLWAREWYPTTTLYAGLYRRSTGWSARIEVPTDWGREEPPPDAATVMLPGAAALVVASTNEFPPGEWEYPSPPWIQKVIARTVHPAR